MLCRSSVTVISVFNSASSPTLPLMSGNHALPAPAKSSHRSFLNRSTALGALAAGLPFDCTGGAYADDSPEVPDMKFGIIALTDCSSIVVAHEKGLFKKSGGNSTVAKGASWAAIRDSLANVNTAVGFRKVPQDFLNVAKVLKLSRAKTLFKVLVPSTMPYMFTGFRLSLGIAWLVIVAVEMLTGRPGAGGFIWQAYNAGSYAQIILCILTIGVVGFTLDRLMSVVERRFKTA